MVNAIARHIWLMLTFRHDGTGLPRSGYLVALLFGIALLFEFFVFGVSPARLIFASFLALLVAAYYNITLVSSASLVTIGIGTIALPFVILFGDQVLMVFDIWDIMVAVYMGVRIGMLMRKG